MNTKHDIVAVAALAALFSDLSSAIAQTRTQTSASTNFVFHQGTPTTAISR